MQPLNQETDSRRSLKKNKELPYTAPSLKREQDMSGIIRLISEANQRLALRGFQVGVANLPSSPRLARDGYYFLNSRRWGEDKMQNIGPFYLRPDTPLDQQIRALVEKTLQHEEAMRVPAILVSPFGTKIDTRPLPTHIQMKMGLAGRLTVNGREVRPFSRLDSHPFNRFDLADEVSYPHCTIGRAFRGPGLGAPILILDEHAIQHGRRFPVLEFIDSLDGEYTEKQRRKYLPPGFQQLTWQYRLSKPHEEVEAKQKLDEILKTTTP